MDYGYMIQLGELDLSKPVHAMSLGKKQHPVYGVIDITPERIQRFADNVNKRTRGIDLDIDYAHKAKDDKAAGWIKTAEARPDGLWLTIEWTEPAKQAIANKEYRYFSADFTDEWVDATGNKHLDVLAGGALTNRPFLKDLAPINFGEIAETRLTFVDLGEDGVYRYDKKADKWTSAPATAFDESTQVIEDNEGGKMDELLKKLADLLGVKLSEEPTDEEKNKLFAEVTTLRETADAKSVETEKAKKFAEEYPEQHAKMLADAQRLDELEKGTRLAETDLRIGEWKHGANAIPPAVHDQVRDFRMSLDTDQTEKFDEVMAEIHKVGLVTLNKEDGGNEDATDGDAATKLEEAISKQLEEGKKDDESYSYQDALEAVEKDNPELVRAYK